jgi:hypothetical protein
MTPRRISQASSIYPLEVSIVRKPLLEEVRRVRMPKTALVGLGVALLLSLPLAAAIPANVAAQGDTIVPGAPISFMTKYYGGATLPVKFMLIDPEGNPIGDANATVWVWWPGLSSPIPGTASGKSNMGNSFRFLPDDMMYIYNLNTKPFPAGPGSGEVTITIKVTEPAQVEWSTMIHFD